MTYKQIEGMRELRLWIGQIIVPLATATATIVMIPEVREAVSEKVKAIRYNAKQKFK